MTKRNGATSAYLRSTCDCHLDTTGEYTMATGYKINIGKVPFLANGNILSMLNRDNDFPALDEYFQTSLPGLFITGMAASQYFGPFFGFTIGVRTSAKLIGKALIKIQSSKLKVEGNFEL